MKLTMTTMILAVALVTGCGDDGDDGGAADAAVGLQVTFIEGATFDGPESVRWDATNQVWYVSNFGEAFMEPNEPGWITRIAADGTVMEDQWATGLSTPLGMAIVDGTLYVADSSSLVAINTADGMITDTIAVPVAVFLNDVTAYNGTVYVSDTVGNAIYSYTPGGAVEIVVQDAALDGPNGLYVGDGYIVIAAAGDFNDLQDSGSFLHYDMASGEITALSDLVGTLDGLAKDGDDYLVTDFAGAMYRIMPDGSYETLIEDAAELGFMSTADFDWDPVTRTVAIPDLSGNQVGVFTLP